MARCLGCACALAMLASAVAVPALGTDVPLAFGRFCWPVRFGQRAAAVAPRCSFGMGLRRSRRMSTLTMPSARAGEDDMGDITRLLDDEPVFTGNSRMFPVDGAVSRAAETDIIMGTGVGQSEQLQDAIDQAVGAAVANWPRNTEGLPTVPSLAIMFFSSHYAEQGLGRVLPCLLRTFATTGGKPWKVGVSVVGCSAEGFDLEDDSTPAVSVTLIQGNLVSVLPFCSGDEVAGWSESDWSYKAGLKGLYDDPTTSLLLLGHSSSQDATALALKKLHSAYPLSTKLGGIAGGARGSGEQDRCVIFRKGTGVLNKKGQLIYGEDKNEAKYSSSDDLFFDGGTWRRSGLVGVAISGLPLDSVCLEAGGDGAQVALARVAAAKSVNKEDSLFAIGGLALADRAGAALLAAPEAEGARMSLKKTLNAPVAATILEKVLVSQESPEDLSVRVELANAACSLNTLYGADAGPAADASNLSEEELDAIAGYENTIVNAAGEILTIPQYDGPPQKRSGGGKKKGKRR